MDICPEHLDRRVICLIRDLVVIMCSHKFRKSLVDAWQLNIMEAEQISAIRWVKYSLPLKLLEFWLEHSHYTCSFTVLLCRWILWLCTELPTINGRTSSPQNAVMSLQIPIFSPPWSVQTQIGLPYFDTAVWNCNKTVTALLLSVQRQNVTGRLKPSIPLCITKRHRTICDYHQWARGSWDMEHNRHVGW